MNENQLETIPEELNVLYTAENMALANEGVSFILHGYI